jgi:hypothetical protein
VKKLLLNCDQVFEVLTRGPFPTGEPQDEAVERHLRACHECRQLAEALRPAVALLHEAVSSEEAEQLPEYQGSLPWQRRPGRRKLAIARLEGPPADAKEVKNAPPGKVRVTRGEPRRPQIVSAMRLIAASLIIAALGLVFGSNLFAPRFVQPMPGTSATAAMAERPMSAEEGVPTAKGLQMLASLKLPDTCLPFSHQVFSNAEAEQIAALMHGGSLDGLKCCTDCHHAGSGRASGPKLMVAVQQACQACHRS